MSETKKKRKAASDYPKVVETFQEPSLYQFRSQDEPSSFNGIVSVRRYRITIELVDEPDEVIAARIQKLWDKCANHHHWESLRAEAKRVGLVLDIGTFGKKRAVPR
jgi:hypothetical protein